MPGPLPFFPVICAPLKKQDPLWPMVADSQLSGVFSFLQRFPGTLAISNSVPFKTTPLPRSLVGKLLPPPGRSSGSVCPLFPRRAKFLFFPQSNVSPPAGVTALLPPVTPFPPSELFPHRNELRFCYCPVTAPFLQIAPPPPLSFFPKSSPPLLVRPANPCAFLSNLL